MNYDKNLRYYENKKMLFYISLGLFAFGLIFYLIGNSRDFPAYLFYIPAFIAGVVLLAVFIMRRSSDKALNEAISDKLQFMHENTLRKFDLYERQLSMPLPLDMTGYIYGDNMLVKRDGNGKYRTPVYSAARLYYTENSVCYYKRVFSLINADDNEEYGEIFYGDIKDVTVEQGETNYTFGNKTFKIMFYTFHIYGDDAELLSCVSPSDAAVDECIDTLKRFAEKSRG